MTDVYEDPSETYDRVTAAWLMLLGEEFHYGVFNTGDEPLDVATAELTARMAAGARFGAGLSVLDVGCGTGAPAITMARRHHVKVTGITTSAVGVAAATKRAQEAGLSDAVHFEQRDGTDNGFPDESFDRVWALESSHLMRARERLISECARVLKPGGRLVLCDLIRHRDIPFAEVRERRRDFATLRAAFGDAHMEPLADYHRYAEAQGLVVDQLDDLTQATLPTFDRWRLNATEHRHEVVAALGQDGWETFVRACDILEGFWRDGTMGYGLIAAHKPA
jgi:27-O-demethylrifamycin SV methyltransferase